MKSICALVLSGLAAIISIRIVQLEARKTEADQDIPSLVFLTTHSDHSLRRRLSNHDGTAALDTRNLETDLFRTAPLSPLPFLAGMIDAAQQGDTHRTRQLAEHALALTPRNEASRLQLAGMSALEGDYETALDQLRVLITLNGRRRAIYLDAMAVIATDPASWPHIEAQLQRLPNWGPALLDRLAETITDKYLYSRLYSYFPKAQGRYVGGLSRRGDWDDAFVAYVSFIETTTLQELSVPFDSEFRGLDAPQPFNWTLNRQFAEMELGGGLYVHFFGRGRPKIASQTLVLSPGQYTFGLDISGETWRGGGGLRWHIRCTDSDEDLVALDIFELNTAGSALSVDFEIPPQDCTFQNLILAGVAGEFPRTTRASIDKVSISAISSAQSR